MNDNIIMSDRSLYPASTKRFFILYLIFGSIWIIGGYNDMWAHAHIPELETFFTPWHAIFYAGWLLLASLFAWTAYANHQNGYAWKFSLPKDYVFAARGLAIFALGGFADMLWHTFFGIEKHFAIMISPPHMLIAVGGMMVTMGFLRGVWVLGKKPEHVTDGMVALIIAYTTLSFNYLLDYFNPFVFPYMMTSFAQSTLFHPQIGNVLITTELSEILGMGSMIIFTTFLMGVILMSIRYWKPPFGTFTLVLTLTVSSVILAYTRNYYFILSTLVAGLVIDLLYYFLFKTDITKYIALRMFGFMVPFVLFMSMAITMVSVDSTLWAFPMWGGSILITGFIGFLLTYILVPSLAAYNK